MIACLSNEKNQLQSSTNVVVVDTTTKSIKKQISESSLQKKGSESQNAKNNTFSPKLMPKAPQRQQEKRTFPFFRQDDKNRLNALRNIINSSQKGKPIRLYIENVPNFANEYDFEERCRGLLNVVWNPKRGNSCFILMENKDFAIDVLDLENELPQYCREGKMFVSRTEENSILYAKKPNGKRFETYFNLNDDSGFFIVENDKMKYFWYDQTGGFYDEYGIYYNQSGRPSPPPYINSRASRSRKGYRGNAEKNNKYQQNSQEQKQQSPKLIGQKYQSNNQVEYIKKSDLEAKDQGNKLNGHENNQFSKQNSNSNAGNNENVILQQKSDNKYNSYSSNRPKSHSSGSFNNKGNNSKSNSRNSNSNKQGRYQKNDGQQRNNENERKGINNNNSNGNNRFNENEDKIFQSNKPSQSNNNNNNGQSNGGYKNRKKANSYSSNEQQQQQQQQQLE